MSPPARRDNDDVVVRGNVVRMSRGAAAMVGACVGVLVTVVGVSFAWGRDSATKDSRITAIEKELSRLDRIEKKLDEVIERTARIEGKQDRNDK